jgi:hypothetical protein
MGNGKGYLINNCNTPKSPEYYVYGIFHGYWHYTSIKIISLPTQRKPPSGGMPGGGKLYIFIISCFATMLIVL